MGTAGLDVKRLAGLLERFKINCDLLFGDESFDHCLLRLTSFRQPGVAALIAYVNQGVEPRIATMMIGEAALHWHEDIPLRDDQKTLRLQGARNDDPEKVANWAQAQFLIKHG